MTPEELSQQELQRERVREEIIKSKIFFSYEELEEMSQADRINAIIQMKQDETMKWQRMSSQMYYWITTISLIIGGIAGFIYVISIN